MKNKNTKLNNKIDIKDIKNSLPELPQARRERFEAEYGLLLREIEIFVQNKKLGEYFEKVMSELRNWIKEKDTKTNIQRHEFLKLAKLCSNYIATDLQGLLKNTFISDKNFLITPENFAEFLSLIYKKQISSKIAKIVLREMFNTGADPSHIIKEKRLEQVVDESDIEKTVKKIIAENPKPSEDFKNGKENALQFLIGQVMSATKGKAVPETVGKILRKILTE